MRRILYFLLLLCLVVGRVPAADFSVSGMPTGYAPGGALSLTASYNKPAAAEEKRLVFFAELHDADTDALLAKQVFDNANNGFTGTGQVLAVSLACPPGGTAPVKVKLFAVPWSLNRAVVEQYLSYPRDGTFTYLWSGGGYGVTQNLYYRGSLVAPKPSGNTTYCSGLAFDAALTAFNNYNTTYGHTIIGTMSVSQMNSFRVVWYGAAGDGDEMLAAKAIPQYGTGLRITDFEEAQEGDFAQLWRTSGSGHNPLFISWLRDSGGQIIGMRYWGTQSSTNGIGIRNEYFTEGGGTIMKSRTYLGRFRKPRDEADYLWSVSSQTSANISANASVSLWRAY